MTVSVYGGTVTIRVRNPHDHERARISIQRRVFSTSRRLENVHRAPHTAMQHERASPWTGGA